MVVSLCSKFSNTMKKSFLFTILFVFSISALLAKEDWGKTGHRAVGEIAEKYLTKKAKRKISKLLDGQSLAFVANYGDEIKSDRKYDKYGSWHYVNFPFGEKYETTTKNDSGDIIRGIHECIAVLENDESLKEEKVFHLKMLIHLVGDLHQPLHIGLKEDKGGNDFQVRWFKSGTNLHTVWDSSMLKFYGMSYTELAANEDVVSKRQVETIAHGSVLDWAYDSREICEEIYAQTEIGEKLSYYYMYKFKDVLLSQLQKGGIRLAKILNELYG